ncbi:DSS1/SEM1 family-domain-containing protein [Polychytrium aggregatum]|uniref:DSS1/SEM1 family-domain-containing protein n=1 Tax=Polychytrium aggregatum TaxID=110093 RepID=UPI0022FEE24C|nr:DSS1/SEM1 family-domain-containing protein [Polychytrium aggregatum]KAI9205016.1 DSS1/SEM1 family-domain-containing protein [Polychytrium aggregatum]
MSFQKPSQQPTPQTQQAPAKPPQLPEIEDDDEFEEFETDDWTVAHEDRDDPALWRDNWDSDHVDDAFSKQLRAELAKLSNPNEAGSK